MSGAPSETDRGEQLLHEARKFEKNLLNFFWRQGVSYSEGEDLVQETYIRLWKHRNDYRPTAKLSTFLFLMARQVRLDALRSDVRRDRREENWMKDRETEQQPANFGAKDDVKWAMSKLPEQMREVVEFAVFQDLPYAEISAILEIPVGTVKSRMSNALKKLKEIFDERRS